jgi:hypothetical protein
MTSSESDLTALKGDWKVIGLTWAQFGDFTQDDIDGLKLQWFPEDALKRGQLQSIWINHHDRKQGKLKSV